MISTESGADENDEDGRDSQAHAAVIVVTSDALSGGVGHDDDLSRVVDCRCRGGGTRPGQVQGRGRGVGGR